MFHRFSTWWRALSVVLLCLATVTWPSAAHAGTTATFSLVHQDAVAPLNPAGSSHFNIALRLSSSTRTAHAQVSLYPRIVTRSQIAPLIDGSGITGRPVASTVDFAMKCDPHHAMAFMIDVFTTVPGRTSNQCTDQSPALRLPCLGQNCDGVFPLRYVVTTNGATTTEWSMIAIQASQVASPLRVDLIASLDPSSWQQSGRTVAVLDTIARYPSIPLALTADYRTLGAVLASATPVATSWRTALNLALTSPLHRALEAPPGEVDYGGLAAHGLSSQVSDQLFQGGQMMRTLNGRYLDTPVVLTGTPSLASLNALAKAGASEVILPESALQTPPSTTLNWGAPFRVTGSHSLLALATDDPLTRLMTDSSIESGRRAALTLATLAFLHFEEPNAPAPRTVVVLAPVADTPATFVDDLLGGFARNPFFVASSIVPTFATALVATNGAPSDRSLVAGSRSTWSSRNVTTLTALAGAVNSYDQAVTSKSVAALLRIALGRAESTGDANARQSLITAATTALNTQLSQFSVDASAITLAGPGTSLPITVLSRANYTVTAVVHLITDRLRFPKGRDIAVTLDSPTKSIRVPASNREGSSLTLQVTMTTPDGQVVLAHAAIQVRIAGTSVVGYLLSFASILVLLLWWLRTYRSRAKGRHAR